MDATPDDWKDLLGDDAALDAIAEPSDLSLPIFRAESFVRLRADTTAIARSGGSNEAMEISLMVFENHYRKQRVSVTETDGDLATLVLGSVEGVPVITEIACVHLSKKPAMDLVTTMLRHMVSKGIVEPEELLAYWSNKEELAFIQAANG